MESVKSIDRSPRNFADLAYAHLAVTRLRSPGKTRRWLENLAPPLHHKPPGHK